jgi:hypothetical protein
MAVEEWDRRQLCPDGGCTGVIGATGVCGTCGRAAPNWGDERKRGMRNPTDAPPIVKDEDDIAPSAPAALGAMADWGTRRLCSDGGCIGVIGPNNKCKACGKPGPAKAKAAAATGGTELERVAAEMAGTATAGDLASIVPASEEEDDEEYEDDDEDSDEAAADSDAHDHGDENDAASDDSSDDASDEDDDADDEDDDSDDDEEDDEDEDEGDDADEGDDDGTISASGGRELCPDGACVGVIDANGLCKVCEKPRDWKEQSA